MAAVTLTWFRVTTKI